MEVLSHNILLFRLLFFGFLFSYASLGNERCSASLATRKHPYHYVHETFRKNNYTITKKFFSHDPSFVPIKYKARQNMIWNQQSVCHMATGPLFPSVPVLRTTWVQPSQIWGGVHPKFGGAAGRKNFGIPHKQQKTTHSLS